MANETTTEDAIKMAVAHLNNEADACKDIAPGVADRYYAAARDLELRREATKALQLLADDEQYTAGELESSQRRLVRIREYQAALNSLTAQQTKVTT